MSFRETHSDVALANRALSLLSQSAISSVDPPQPTGTPSREANRWYKPTVARLLELHHWNLATERVTLTETTNDRTAEWLYKYALPPRVAFPVSLSVLSGATGISYYRGLQGLLAQIGGSPAYLMVGRSLYSRYAGDLDFVSYDITEASFDSTFAGVVVQCLAAAMCMGVTKNRLLTKELREQADSAVNMAIAQNLNANRLSYGEEVSARDLARGEMGLNGYGSWDWWPGLPA